ncbi:MAG: acyltransferase [Lachnospiraceae bacterium]|nr:acyltransferase [Lachnospiraceae bacterium]
MNSNNIPTSSRSTWMDCIKIIATFLIMVNHGVSHVWTSHPIDTFTWKIIHMFFLMSRIAVPLFFICSGAGMLRKEHSISQIFIKNIFRLLKIYVAWMLVYGAIDCISLFPKHLASPRTCINAFVKSIIFGQYHTWFILTLLSLYLITPFLFQITRTRESMNYFLILSFIFTILFPWIRSLSIFSRLTETLDNFNMNFVCGYTLYYVAGHYICTIPWKKVYSQIAAIIFFISFGITYVSSMNLSITSNVPYQDSFMELSPLMTIISLSAFCIFRGLDEQLKSRIIKPLITYGFALYLMHPLFLQYVQKLSGLYTLCGTVALYFSCVYICFLISRSKLLSRLLLR